MDHLVAQYLERLRLRLLDLSGRNRFLNFKFSERSRTQIRLVDELPDQVFEKLEKGTALTIASLLEPPEHPTDCEHSQTTAIDLGFLAMQFNFRD